MTIAPIRTAPPAATPLPAWSLVVLPLATALLLRAGLGYRAFPSVDDFAYFPIALHHADPSWFATDLMVGGNLLHTPIWPFLVSAFGSALPAALWVFTMALTIATVAAVFRLMRVAGAQGLLLPIAVLLAFCVRANGLGRATYDGAFGDAFHMQWLALCLLLWSYDLFARRAPVAAGVLLGLSCLAHPVVAAHGAVVLALASLWTGPGSLRRLAVTGLACVVVSLPATVPLVGALLSAGGGGGDAAALIRDAVMLRVPHEYDLSDVPYQYWLLLGLTLLAGVGGAALLAATRPSAGLRGVVGLLFGHAVLLAAAVAVHGPAPLVDWGDDQLLVYALHLTRTSALPLVLAAVLALAAVEVGLDAQMPPGTGWRVLAAGLMATLITLGLANVLWRPSMAALMLIGLALALVRRQRRLLIAGLGAFAALSATGFTAFALQQPRTAAPPPAEAALYAWARENTARDALFVIPPGLQGFRSFARRGAYVDFKIFSVGVDPALTREWRRRLELVAAPDAVALAERGWLAVPHWDRSYAIANTPGRSAELLRETGADYLVWDARGLEVPPFLPPTRPADRRVETAFANERFTVYRLKEAADD